MEKSKFIDFRIPDNQTTKVILQFAFLFTVQRKTVKATFLKLSTIFRKFLADKVVGTFTLFSVGSKFNALGVS